MKKYTRVLAILAFVLLGARLLLPYGVKKYVLRTLNKIPDTHVEIADIDIALIRGAYKIQGLNVRKGAPPALSFSSRNIDLSVQWKALFEGALVGEIYVFEPVLEFVGGQNKKAEPPAKEKARVIDRIKELFPLEINRFEVVDGNIRFNNPKATPPVNLYIRAFNITATNLTNSRDLSDTLVATINGQGTVMSHGFLGFGLKLDPFQKQPTFQLDFKLENIRADELNDFMVHYAGMNFESGNLGVYIEAAAKGGAVTGYVKPIFKDLKIMGDKRKELTVGQKIKEFFAELASKIIKNREKKTIATRIEFEGKFDDPEMTVWGAIREALRHAFVQALLPNIEDRISLEDVDS